MSRRVVALAVATVIGIASATAVRLFRRRSPAERPPPVRNPPTSVSTPIRVLDVGIRTPPREPVPPGLLTRVVLSPLALLAAYVRLRRRLSRTARRPRPHPPGSARVLGRP